MRKRDFPYVLGLVVVDLDRGTIDFQGDDGLTAKRPSLPRHTSQTLEEQLQLTLSRIVQDADDLHHDSSERQASAYPFPEGEVQSCFHSFVSSLLVNCGTCSTALRNAQQTPKPPLLCRKGAGEKGKDSSR